MLAWRKCPSRYTSIFLGIQGGERDQLRALSGGRSHGERIRSVFLADVGTAFGEQCQAPRSSGLLQVVGSQQGWLGFSDRPICKRWTIANVGPRGRRNATSDMLVFVAGIERTERRIVYDSISRYRSQRFTSDVCKALNDLFELSLATYCTLCFFYSFRWFLLGFMALSFPHWCCYCCWSSRDYCVRMHARVMISKSQYFSNSATA